MQPNQPYPEQVPAVPLVTPEAVSQDGLERAFVSEPETGNSAEPPPPPPLASHNVTLAVTQAEVVTAQTQLVVPVPPTSPLAAADADLIEEHWVEAVAKIKETQAQDPHSQEAAAEQLSRQYLKQRFNLDVDAAA